MEHIQKFEKFNKLSDTEFTNKVKIIMIDFDGTIIKALAGGANRMTIEGDVEYMDNTFYFKTDKENTFLLRKLNIDSINMIDTHNDNIIFNMNDGTTKSCKFRIKLFSGRKLIDWHLYDDDEYVTWKI